MTGNYSDLWPNVDEPTEVVRVYERSAQLKPDDAQMHFDYGMAFTELGRGLEDRAVKAFKQPHNSVRPGLLRTHNWDSLTLQPTGAKRLSKLTRKPSRFNRMTQIH